MIIDHTNRRVLDVLESREKAVVVGWLQARVEDGLLAEVEEVTADMWTAYTEAAREVFGEDVRIVIDRFHVMKNFQEQLEKARRQIQRGLSAEAAKALKGLRWLLITNPENLTPDQQQELEELKALFPELGRLHDLRESLRSLFEDQRLRRPETAMQKFRAWIAEARRTSLKALDSFCRTLENWMPQIANYFVSRSSNGRTEGFNTGLRSILRRAFGMRNFEHFRLRVLHLFGQPEPQEST